MEYSGEAAFVVGLVFIGSGCGGFMASTGKDVPDSIGCLREDVLVGFSKFGLL